MDITGLIPHIEALIFASDKPLSVLELTELLNNAFGFMEDKISLDQVEASMEGIVEKYQSEFYPFEVLQSGGGWQFLTKKEFHKTVAQLNGDKFMKRLSAAALETLAIIAYKQPVTKGEIEAIRGVSADYAVQRLLEKDLIIISGRNEKLPGHPLVYATSKSFMDYFGINSSDDLPKIKEVLSEQLIQPTSAAEMYINEALPSEEDAEVEHALVVTETGELIVDGTENDIADGSEDIGSLNQGQDGEILTDDKKQVQEENPGAENDHSDKPQRDGDDDSNSSAEDIKY